MAGGKMSARQKMINLMYLVFIAMLAMNMSKEVLSAFGFMNEEIVISNNATSKKNTLSYEGLALKAEDQPEKFKPLNEKAKQIKAASASFYSYLSDLKSKMTADIEDKKDYEAMDKTDFLDNYFFQGDKNTKEGQEFVDNINNYRETVIKTLGPDFKDLNERTKFRFNTTSDNNQDWLDRRYKGFPLIASLTNITQLQANVKNTESDVLVSLLGGQLEADSKLTTNNYKGIVSLNKTAYFAGEKVSGQVVLGRYDSNLVPSKVTLNGQDITNNVQNGQVLLDMPAGNVGEKTIKGEITFMQDGKPEVIPFESKYSVIAEPSSAVVSADKMNVVYRGLNNPISVSLPGVSGNNLRVSASGGTLSGSNSSYNLRPGAGNIATINVSATLSSGKTVNSKATFRIKDIPAAMGSVREQFGVVKMPKSGLSNAPISAGLPDFEFDLKIAVQSFKIKVPGELTIIVNGTRLNAAAKKVLSKAKRGDQINIYDIQATANGVKLKKVLPVTIELTN
ncbi:gliding motility protein GldM [Polaribacter aestuariivivens]|uniref:Gliding motility protein GldM n=1 Tax=Polaribacter aestuariivivens TaxID=2304626 RepID=A0A5S3N2P8_9FLAO|nr:gliding motility protein GldM [Polaribacter aestuariivivens]TMM29565.1 gliding motility protein GldM [Polaribacter aestuariivivens]